jgi:simple sugar transport system permease protein
MRALRTISIQALAVAVGVLLACAILQAAIGVPVSGAISTLFDGSAGSGPALGQTTLKFVPLALTGLAVALPLRMRLWNIGAEGQYHVGAIGASVVCLKVRGLSQAELLVLAGLAGMVGGTLFALLAAIPRALWGVNEIITTLLLNYVGIALVSYLVVGPLKGTQSVGFPISDQFPAAASFPLLAGGPVHIAVIFPLVAALAIFVLLRFTRLGFEIQMIGASPSAARVVGMSAPKNTILVMGLGGALAGLAGMVEIVGSFGALQQGISPGYGYMAIIIAALASASLPGTLVLAYLFGGFIVGGLALQTANVPAAFVSLLQGIILFAALAGARLAGLRSARLRPTRRRRKPVAGIVGAPGETT